MITVQGSVPYPPTARSAPIRALATNLQQLSQSLVEGGQQLSTTAQRALGTWAGEAASAYLSHTNQRARTVTMVGTALAKTAPVLQTLAAAIDSTSAAYSTAATAEHAARAGLPWTAPALAAAIAAQSAALAGLQAAGAACGGALVAIEAEIAAAQFLGVDKATLDGLKDAAGSIWGNVVDLVTTGDTDAAVSALDHTIDVIGLVSILAAATATGQAQRPRLTQQQQQLVDLGTGLSDTKNAVKPFVWTAEGAAAGLHHATHRYASQVHRRNGTVYTRWTVAGRGSSLGVTQQQAAAFAGRAHRWMRPVPALGATVDGAVQYMTDAGNTELTTTQRVNRTATATTVQGLTTWGGAAAGAKGGAVVGGMIGAVPGAVIGGVVGAIGGGLAGSSIGKWVKEELFAWNPGGAYR